jgi:PAS domain S-box-containing protein
MQELSQMLSKLFRYRICLIFILFIFLKSNEGQSQSRNLTDKDSIDIKEILKLAKELEKTKPDSSLQLINLLLKNITDKKSVYYTDAIIAKGSIYYYSGNTDSSLYYFTIAKDLSQFNHFRFKEIQSINFIALNYKKRGNYSECFKHLNQSIEKSKAYGLKEREATAYNNMGLAYRELGMYDKSIRYLSQAYQINILIGDSTSIMIVMNNLGLINKDLMKYDEALKYYDQMLKIAEIRKDNMHKSMAYLNIGVVYKEKKQYDKALDYYYKSLNLKKAIGDEYKIAINLTDIGDIYNETGQFEKAITYYEQAFQIYQRKGSFKEKIEINNHLAKAYINIKRFPEAILLLNQSLNLLKNKSSENLKLYSTTYYLLALYYKTTKDYQKALEYQMLYSDYQDSLKNRELSEKIAEEKIKFDFQRQEEEIKTLTAKQELDSIKLEAQSHRLKLNNYINTIIVLLIIVAVFLVLFFKRRLRKNKRINKLLQNNRKIILEKNYEITQQNEEIKAQTDQLYEINKELSQFMAAVNETDNAVVILDKEGYFIWGNKGFDRLYEADFKDFIDTNPHILDAAKKKSNHEEITRVIKKCIHEKTSGNYEFTTHNRSGENIWIQTSIKAVLDDFNEIQNFIVIDTDISENVKTGRLIEIQNFELNRQKEEIDSGLRYAQNIQHAMLPSPSNMKEFNDLFLIYLPKDIVSGDFYKYYCTEESPYLYYVVIDCTGHGVPGAFISMIAEGLLTQAITKKDRTLPSEILEEMYNSVKITLKQQFSGNRDGMDISVCRIEKEDKEIKEVVFCGAQHSLYHFNQLKKKLTKIKGDVRSIGGHYYDDVAFTDKYLKARKGDMIYLLTDGFIDQDSPEGKKIGSNHLFEYLEEIGSLTVKKQKKFLIRTFKEHKKETHQRDDITILGIKIGK